MADLYGGVETGGTWCVCALGTATGEIVGEAQFRTGAPGPTLDRIVAFFAGGERPRAIGIGSFGPVDLDVASPTWGHVTNTPKPGWAHTAVAPVLRDRLRVAVAFDTDVSVAALGELRWGAGAGLPSLCYLTVGTGIGAGIIIDGRPVQGLVHPEVGHLRVPHDRAADPFDGVCPVHGDCWEGLASGPAISARWGAPAAELPDEHPGWELEAAYVALGIHAIVSVVSPHRVVLGGGVMDRPGLRAAVARRLTELNGGYLQAAELTGDSEGYVVAPALGDRSGVRGAIALAAELAAGGGAGGGSG